MHEKEHARPWKCSVPECEYSEGGFISRRMRDDHLERGHIKPNFSTHVEVSRPTGDEITPLLYDLIKANDVKSVIALQKGFKALNWDDRKRLRELAAFSGSPAMADIIIEPPSGLTSDIIKTSIRGRNSKTVRHLL